MDIHELSEMFQRSTQSAFRLETLPQYLVPQETDEFQAWKSGETWPLATPDTDSWLATVQEKTQRGYRHYRVHILDYPLSDYMRFELYGYQANQAAGEEIYLADRSADRVFEDYREDFWLLDDEIGIRMVYDNEGRFIRPERVEQIEHYRDMRDRALQYVVSLGEYLNGRDPRLLS